eukprot:2265742-Prymnesium_polylepis.1
MAVRQKAVRGRFPASGWGIRRLGDSSSYGCSSLCRSEKVVAYLLVRAGRLCYSVRPETNTRGFATSLHKYMTGAKSVGSAQASRHLRRYFNKCSVTCPRHAAARQNSH